MLLLIAYPPGFNKNGPVYTRKGNWSDGNLVRYHDGATRPIGGWERREDGTGDIAALVADPTLEAVRDIFSWRANDQTKNTVFGSNLNLYHMNAANAITTVTHAGYTPNNSSKNQVEVANEVVPPDRWYADNFGELLLTGVRNNGAIQELDLGTLTLSTVTGAPTDVQDLCVSEQRQVVVIGGGGQPRRLQASDIEDRNLWTVANSNQVVDRTLPGTGKLLRCIRVLRQILLLGENDAHAVNYIAPPFVFSVNQVGESCGPVAAEAVATTDRFAVWWGQRNFWIYDGSLKVLDCSVASFLFNDFDPDQATKISVYVNSDFTEITWLYQSKSSTTTECDSYVSWDYRENAWFTGRINRTAGVDKGVLDEPVLVDEDGLIFNHEISTIFPNTGDDVFVETGPLDIADGGRHIAVKGIYADVKDQFDIANGLQFSFTGRYTPDGDEFTFGPFVGAANQVIATTGTMGMHLQMRARFLVANTVLGHCRLDIVQGGTPRR